MKFKNKTKSIIAIQAFTWMMVIKIFTATAIRISITTPEYKVALAISTFVIIIGDIVMLWNIAINWDREEDDDEPTKSIEI